MISSRTALIGVDWGTSRARALLLDAAGEVIEARSNDQGILAVPDGGFPTAFTALCGDWHAVRPDLPVVMAGMVGSANGWLDAGYVDTPVGPAALASRLVPVPGQRGVWVVPGLRTSEGPAGGPDLMRGEETQLAGLMASSVAGGIRDGIVCLPGTHSKWARLDRGAVQAFGTYMTGEMFGLWRQHGLLGRLITDERHVVDAFVQGVVASGRPGGLLHHLFAARALPLAERLPRSHIASWLSGLLIGHECRAVRDRWLATRTGRPTVILIGSGRLTTRYASALSALEIGSTRIDGTAAVARGLIRLARAAGLCPTPREDIAR